jgi:hypothetical protein
MVSCYTDQAGLFVSTQKQQRDRPGEEVDPRDTPSGFFQDQKTLWRE